MSDKSQVPKLLAIAVGTGLALWPLFIEAENPREDAFPHLGLWLLFIMTSGVGFGFSWPQYEKTLAYCITLPILSGLIAMSLSFNSDIPWMTLGCIVAAYWIVSLLVCSIGGFLGKRIRRLL